MMDEAWTRHWVAARKAARAAREQMLADAARNGRPAPTLWGDLRALVRDLIDPPVPGKTPQACADATECQSVA